MSYKILVLEDDPTQSKPLIEMLRYRGYDIFHASNGLDGISQTIEYRPHLIIIDLLLVQKGDDMDGYDVIKALRDTPETKDIAILAWTGHFVNRKDEIRALRSGADDFVTKDIEFGALEARLEALLRRVTRISE